MHSDEAARGWLEDPGLAVDNNVLRGLNHRRYILQAPLKLRHELLGLYGTRATNIHSLLFMWEKKTSAVDKRILQT